MKRPLFILCLLSFNCSTDDPKVCPDFTCDDYETQEIAQAAYDADPACMGGLDADGDRLACEHLIVYTPEPEPEPEPDNNTEPDPEPDPEPEPDDDPDRGNVGPPPGDPCPGKPGCN